MVEASSIFVPGLPKGQRHGTIRRMNTSLSATPEISLRPVLLRTFIWMALATLTLLGAYALPPLPLDGPAALIFYWLTEMAGKYGITVILFLLSLVVITRPHISRRQRIREGIVLFVAVSFTNGAMAYFNEHILKPALAIPRPDVLELILEGRIDLTAEAFYQIGEKVERSLYLAERLPPGTPGMHDEIRRHWIRETGYSFPSGHALSAMTTATFFLAWAFAVLQGWRKRLMQALVPWAILAAYSRPILRVHSATDILVGASQGVVTGLLGYSLCYVLLREPSGSQNASDPASPNSV